MGISELNNILSSLYGNLKPFTLPCPFHLQIAHKTIDIAQTREETIYHIIKYILDPKKSSIYSGNVFIPHFHSITENTYTCITNQFIKIKEHYDKLTPYPIIHIIITFHPEYQIDGYKANSIMESLIFSLGDFFTSHQYIYAIHNKQWNAKENRITHPHIHLAISTTNYRTGKTLDFNKSTIKKWESNLLFSMEHIIAPILEQNKSNLERIAKRYQIPL